MQAFAFVPFCLSASGNGLHVFVHIKLADFRVWHVWIVLKLNTVTYTRTLLDHGSAQACPESIYCHFSHILLHCQQ